MTQAIATAGHYTAAAQAANPAVSDRIASVDFMRGVALVLMAIDHLRDFLTNIPVEPEDVAHTWPALFFTRWITHFCAPLFFFLAGTGAYLYRARTGSLAAASRFLFTRGLWLVVLEFTIIEYAWTFVFWRMGGVIWSLGCSMILLAVLVWLPEKVILALGLAVVLLHDLFDAVKPAQLGSFDWLWSVLHRKGVVPHTHFFVLFPILPLAGVMMLGYVFGKLFEKPIAVRSRITLWIGVRNGGVYYPARVQRIWESGRGHRTQFARRVARSGLVRDDGGELSRYREVSGIAAVSADDAGSCIDRAGHRGPRWGSGVISV